MSFLKLRIPTLLKQVDWHEIWKDEFHFSKWLTMEDNLKKLGDVIGINIIFDDSDLMTLYFDSDNASITLFLGDSYFFILLI